MRANGPQRPGAVSVSLKWLGWQQGQSGAWSEVRPGDESGITGLVLLAFLGAGHTDRTGAYRKVVKKALKYLWRCQRDDGLIQADGRRAINHVLATLALTDAYRLTRSPTLQRIASKAVAYLIKAPHAATAWTVLAFQSARLAGLRVTGLDAAFRSTTRAVLGSRTGRADMHSVAIRMLCRILGGSRNDLDLRGDATMLASVPPFKGMDPLRGYYSTLAMYWIGRDFWRQWNRDLRQAVVVQQRRDPGDPERGSWDPTGPAKGRVYTTALHTLTLEIYYRYAWRHQLGRR